MDPARYFRGGGGGELLQYMWVRSRVGHYPVLPSPCSAVNQDLQGCEPMHVFLASSRISTLNPWVPRIAYSFGNILVKKFGVGKRYFPCIACKVFSLCRQETNINGLERLLNSLLTFCKSVAADCRGQLCQLGEDLIPALLPVWSKPYPHVKVLF